MCVRERERVYACVLVYRKSKDKYIYNIEILLEETCATAAAAAAMAAASKCIKYSNIHHTPSGTQYTQSSKYYIDPFSCSKLITIFNDAIKNELLSVKVIIRYM